VASYAGVNTALIAMSAAIKAFYFSTKNAGLMKKVIFETYLLPCHVDWYKVSDVSEEYAASIFRV
jgi:hypothetical protein